MVNIRPFCELHTSAANLAKSSQVSHYNKLRSVTDGPYACDGRHKPIASS